MNKFILAALLLTPLFSIAQKEDGPDLIFANEDFKTLTEAKMKYLIVQCVSNYSTLATYNAAIEIRKKQIDWYIHQLDKKVTDEETSKSLYNSKQAWEKLVENDLEIYAYSIRDKGNGEEDKDMLAEKSYNLYTERALYLREMMNQFDLAER